MIEPFAVSDMTTESVETAYVLHLRPYTDSRILLTLLSPEFGILNAVARLSKRQTKGAYPLFTPAFVEWMGRPELKTLKQFDTSGQRPFALQGHMVFCGLYINELLCRLLPQGQPLEHLFWCYERCLQALVQVAELPQAEPHLRIFELSLITELGYGLSYDVDCEGHPLQPEITYAFEPETGWRPSTSASVVTLTGQMIAQLGAGQFDGDNIKLASKQLLRKILEDMLGGKPLKSRELFT